MMISHLIFRFAQCQVPPFMLKRFLSLTQMKFSAMAQLKDNQNESFSTNQSHEIKVYSENIRRIVDEISKLSLIEFMDLNELLKQKEQDDEQNARASDQSLFKVRLIKINEENKLRVIKQVKDVVENINIVQAKKIVDSIPQVLHDNLSKEDAETIKIKFEAIGAVCVIE